MSIELRIEIKEAEGGKSYTQVSKAESEKFPTLEKAVEMYRERFKDLGRDRDTAVGAGISMGLIGAWMIQYGVTKGDGITAAAGGGLHGAGLALSVYSLTAVQEKYKAARNTFNQLRDRLSPNN